VESLHSLLIRQLKRCDADLSAVPHEWRAFVEAVNEAYRQFDEDRTMLERSLDLSSQELLQANADLQSASEARFQATFNQAAVGLAHVSRQGRFMLVNRRLCEMLGYSEAELMRKTVKDVSFPEDRDVADDLVRRLHSGEIAKFSIEKRYLHSSGATLWVNLTVAHISGPDEELGYDVSVIEDITARKQIEHALERMAKYDTLSGLPNRNLLKDRLDQAKARARRAGQPLGFVLFDLDRFKEINDTLGHIVGDALLSELAQRLKSSMRDTDTVARLGGDEFTVIIEGCASREDIGVAAAKIHRLFDSPFVVSGQEIYSTPSIGVCVYPDDGEDFAELIKNADIAMYAAKRDGGNGLRFFAKGQHLKSAAGISMHGQLRRALERNEFELQYQPKVETRSGKVIGFEALIRWPSSERGPIAPPEFIRLAEETGLIVPIGEWVLATACSDLRKCQIAGLADLTVAVNLSGRQFRDERLTTRIATALSRSGVDPRSLELEITESVMMDQSSHTTNILDELVNIGIRVSIDDFGTGYSSLAYLKRFPVHALKIDRGFVRDIETDGDDAAIVKAIVQLAHSMDLRVIAEGVETQEQLAYLAALHCDEYQGFLFSRPLPREELIRLIHTNRSEDRVSEKS
jgi:diguanylate cyclase (GGDEF)-like protein/PAS domain S-box-containing protein